MPEINFSTSQLAKLTPSLFYELTYLKTKHLLGKKGIAVIILKGPHLACVYYEKPEERIYSDLDLLVPGERFHEAAKLLLQAGFRPLKWDRRRLANVSAKYNWGFMSPQGKVLELHRDFCDYKRHRPDLPGIFARAESFNFGKTAALGLAAQDLLLQLCLHAGKSFFISIKKMHIRDMALVIGKHEIVWDDFCAKAAAWEVKTVSWLALRAARLQYDAAVPDKVLRTLRPGFWRRRWLEKRLDLSAFPLYRFADDRLRRSQLGLLFALMDRKRHWPVFCVLYVRMFFADRLLRMAIFREPWLKRHRLVEEMMERG